MSRKLLLCCLALVFFAGSSAAQEASESVDSSVEPGVQERLLEIVETARESSQDDHRYNLETLSCGEFEDLAVSEAQADQAVVAMLMVWSHGYKSGLEGIDFQARPVSLEGLLDLTGKAVDECTAHPEMLFHIAVGRIR